MLSSLYFVYKDTACIYKKFNQDAKRAKPLKCSNIQWLQLKYIALTGLAFLAGP